MNTRLAVFNASSLFLIFAGNCAVILFFLRQLGQLQPLIAGIDTDFTKPADTSDKEKLRQKSEDLTSLGIGTFGPLVASLADFLLKRGH
jgi:hypothetical protein